MSKARIVFLSVPGLDAILSAMEAEGWGFDGSVAPGVSVTATYAGRYPRAAVHGAVSEMDGVGVDYVAVTGAGFDPAMDGPSPAMVEVSARWQEEGRTLRVPSGFQMPAADVRTLVAAGMGHAEASACIASVKGGAMPFQALSGARAA